MPFTPVDAPNLASAAADQIRQLIALDVLGPGDALPGERELADRMGISRTSIRTALQGLVTEGLLVSRHGSGLRVAETLGATVSDPLLQLLDSVPQAFEDFLSFRAMFEGECAADVAERANPAERAEIRSAHEAMQMAIEREDLDSAAQADVEFHMAIVEATGNVVSIQLARSLHELLRRGVEWSHRLTRDDPAAVSELVAQHARVLDAIDSRDAGAARQAMRDHLAFQRDLLLRQEAEDRRRVLAQKRRAWALEQEGSARRTGGR